MIFRIDKLNSSVSIVDAGGDIVNLINNQSDFKDFVVKNSR